MPAWKATGAKLAPTSPEICVRPSGVSAPKTNGMPPLMLKELVSASATFCWLTLRLTVAVGSSGGGLKLNSKFKYAWVAS